MVERMADTASAGTDFYDDVKYAGLRMPPYHAAQAFLSDLVGDLQIGGADGVSVGMLE